jgi:Flp pilus assembly protein TadD
VSLYLRDAGRVDDAIAHLRAAAPESPNARHALASALLERGDVQGSISEFRQFIKESPGDPAVIDAREEFGIALLRAGDRDGALAQYQEVLRTNPDRLLSRRQVLVILLDAQRFSEAEAEARAILAVDSRNPEAHNLLGVALASQGKIAEAREQFADAVRLEPSYENARNNLARADEVLKQSVR